MINIWLTEMMAFHPTTMVLNVKLHHLIHIGLLWFKILPIKILKCSFEGRDINTTFTKENILYVFA